MGFRVTAYSGSARKRLLSAERFYFFDLGARNAAAELPLETAAARGKPRPYFEQWAGMGTRSADAASRRRWRRG